MVVGEIPESVDLLVVGGGPGGYTAAIRAAQLGREVVLVERGGSAGLGGTCLTVGCIPSKALIETAELRHRVSRFAAAGLRPAWVEAPAGEGATGEDPAAEGTAGVAAAGPADDSPAGGELGFDMDAWQDWKSGIVAGLTGGVAGLLRANGVTLVDGTLHFTRRNQAVVETAAGTAKFFQFGDVIIATGSRPTGIPGLAVDGVTVHDSTSLLALREAPESLVVIGGGTIGLELGTALAKLGTAVTIVEGLPQILGFAEDPVRRAAVSSLRSLGIELLTDTRFEGFADGVVTVSTPQAEAEEGRASREIPAAAVLVATGRRPNTDDLGLENLSGVTVDAAGLIEVGADCRAKTHVAAIGDVVAGPALAHKATAQAVVAAEALSGRATAFEPAAIPVVVFSDPEIAVAGLSTAQAQAAGLAARAVDLPLMASGRAQTMGAARPGLLRLVAEESTGVVLGAQFAGPHASELIGEAVLAIEMGATVEDLALTIHPHPTLSEQLHDAAELWAGVPLSVPPPRARR